MFGISAAQMSGNPMRLMHLYLYLCACECGAQAASNRRRACSSHHDVLPLMRVVRLLLLILMLLTMVRSPDDAASVVTARLFFPLALLLSVLSCSRYLPSYTTLRRIPRPQRRRRRWKLAMLAAGSGHRK